MSSDITVKKATECVAIIKSAALAEHGLEKQSNEYASRAGPNQRLVIGFAVDNCFTTEDKASCAAFRDVVMEKLYVVDDVWVERAKSIKDMVQYEMRRSGSETSLFDLVQLVTMKAVMEPLFDRDMHDHSHDHDIRRLATEINEQWLRSKEEVISQEQPEWAFENQEGLQRAIKAVFPNWDGQDRATNPLNLILPAYETMWRVVLRCFVEVFGRDHSSTATWRERLQAFAARPSSNQLDQRSSTRPGVAAKHIAMEALRLYTPTRRVYREYTNAEGKKVKVAADIEAVHRDRKFWGPDAELYRPERWFFLPADKDSENDHWMPFSTSPFACPARRRKTQTDGASGKTQQLLPFAVSLIALLVDAIATEADGKWRIEGKLPEYGEPLSNERKAHSDLALRKLSVPSRGNGKFALGAGGSSVPAWLLVGAFGAGCGWVAKAFVSKASQN